LAGDRERDRSGEDHGDVAKVHGISPSVLVKKNASFEIGSRNNEATRKSGILCYSSFALANPCSFTGQPVHNRADVLYRAVVDGSRETAVGRSGCRLLNHGRSRVLVLDAAPVFRSTNALSVVAGTRWNVLF
jgi:hypothetical protein